jgi:hypothetical protein
MPEAARILALFSALLLLASVVIWTNMLRGPLLQRLDGRRGSNDHPAELAGKALFLAVGVSAVAAILAVAGWSAS